MWFSNTELGGLPESLILPPFDFSQIDPALMEPWAPSPTQKRSGPADSETCAKALLALGGAATAEAPPMPTTPINRMADGLPDEIIAGWLPDAFDPHDPAQFLTSYSYMDVPFSAIFSGALDSGPWEH